MTDWRIDRTTRWRGVVAVTLVSLAVGLLLRRPAVMLVSVVGVAFGAYAAVTTPATPPLTIERRLDDPSPKRGQDVDVTVTLHNEGDTTMSDVRIVDGVPPALHVTDGSPRHASVLRPGESTSFTYAVTAERGKHGFEPATVLSRSLSGEREAETTVATETEIDCMAGDVTGPLRDQQLPYVGRVPSERGGSGVEFYRTREYQHGDPMNRIDWNRYARTSELTTMEFRHESTASVVILVDARAVAYRSRPDEPHAVSHAVSAAHELASGLSRDRNQVGLAAFGRSDVWMPPDAGRDHVDALQDVLATHAAFASSPPRNEPPLDEELDRLRYRLADRTQLLVLSPLTDDDVVTALRTLAVEGHPTTVVSPTVTTRDAPERVLAAVEREHRISTLRNADVAVVEWDTERPLLTALDDRDGRARP